jgi:hypothetical protein
MPDRAGHVDPEDPLGRLVRNLTRDRVAGTDSGFLVLQTDLPYHGGTSAVALGLPMRFETGSLDLPARTQPSPMDYMGVYLTFREYSPDMTGMEDAADGAYERFGRQLIGCLGRDEMINQLCGLGVALTRPEIIADLTAGLEAATSPTLQARLRAALGSSPPHRLLARQPILVALARAFMDDGTFTGDGLAPTRPEIAAVMLTHTVAVGLNWGDTPPGEPHIGGFPEHVASDLVCNQTLYSGDDVISVLDRTLRLWREFGAVGADKLGGRHPAELLERITGLEVEDFLALGFALYVQRLNWAPGQPFRLADTFGSHMAEEKKAAFLQYIARTPYEMTNRLRSDPPRSGWDLMAFVESPVLHYPGIDGSSGGLVVIDVELLIEKITMGLYWIVHDHLRDTEGDGSRRLWTQAWGDMVEAMIEDNLRAHAPQILGGQSAYFTEEDLRSAYPGHKTSDVVIDAGDVLLAVEIGSGRPSVETVRAGDPSALRKDLERLAFKKIRQLDDTATCLIDSPVPLLGAEAPKRPVQPVVVAAGGFFMSPVTANAIAEYCTDNGFLSHALVRTPCVITVDEVEMLEGLVENRHIALGIILKEWKASELAAVSLRNYLLNRFGPEILTYRPPRMRPRFDQFTEEVMARLRLHEEAEDGENT